MLVGELWYQMNIYDYLKEDDENACTKESKDKTKDISNVEREGNPDVNCHGKCNWEQSKWFSWEADT